MSWFKPTSFCPFPRATFTIQMYGEGYRYRLYMGRMREVIAYIYLRGAPVMIVVRVL
nr:hypothetical protein Q903MT_gene4743 [Picea sitchensis]